jgi:light-regulated signal transduction histidine kinase (bacteriophytochrome)
MLIALISFVLLLNELKRRLQAQALLETRAHTLTIANNELQQISQVTSHDLQEPLRKIRTLSDVLVLKFAENLPEEAKSMLERIDKNSIQIRDLANKNERESKNIDLNRILLNTQKELAVVIKNKNALFFISPLPVIRGFEDQLHILFKELITNSIKFSKENIEPQITITGNLVRGDQLPRTLKLSDRSFNVISIYDNGIGFENQYADKVFVLFQKLHGNNFLYKGKGIGLAFCQRIMTNHEGFIIASGEVGKGAVFQLYFPIG